MKRNKRKGNSLEECLRELHLPAIRSYYKDAAEEALKDSLSYENYLSTLVQRECEERFNNRIERRLRESRLSLNKNFETFEMSRLPLKLRQQLNYLTDGGFIDRQENILVFGNPGSGKTHFLSAIGQELIRKGRRVITVTCSLLIQELLLAKKNLNLPRLLKKYGAYEIMFIDDFGYVEQSREEMEVLFTLLSDRYERGSIFLTSNLPFSKWEAIFKDPMTCAATIDRLVHHSIILEMNLPSYRMEHAQKAKEKGGAEKEGKEAGKKKITQ